MDVTIAICTRNRAASLRRTLTSLANMEIPGGLQWEVAVVDNGSSDDTASVINSFAGALPVRYAFEPNPGLSPARNQAVDVATGKYIIWTDDDVVVDPQWLTAYAAAFVRWPDAEVFGGKIVPVFQGPVPAWLSSSLPVVAGAFAMRDFGDCEMELDCSELPYGANYALRASAQRAVRYRVDLGPGTELYGEETDVMLSVLVGGKKWRWVPESKVQHCIAPERMTLAYIDHFFSRYGRSLAHMEEKSGGPQLFGAPRWYWRRLLSHAALYFTRRLSAGPDVWMEQRVWYDIMRGKIEYYRQRHAKLKTANGKTSDAQSPQ